jgi:NTP pyrophosphatase (non-canonical NTP hydrolase)
MSNLTNGLSFRTLRDARKRRNAHPAYKKCKDWTTSDWLQAIVGELGEYANLSKKHRRGDLTDVEFQQEAAKELADIVCYVDELSAQLGIDLGKAIIAKFNEVSLRIDSNVYIGDDDDWHLREMNRPDIPKAE